MSDSSKVVEAASKTIWTNRSGHTLTVVNVLADGVLVEHPDGRREVQPYEHDQAWLPVKDE